jgi:hypothetical protein
MISRRNFLKGLAVSGGLTLLNDSIVRADDLEKILVNEYKTYPKSLLVAPGPNDNKLWLASKDCVKGMYAQVGLIGQDSRWHIAQWDILEELPNKTIDLGNNSWNSWQIENKYATVKVFPAYSGYRVELKQDSSDTRFGCNEFDLLLEPNCWYNNEPACNNVPLGIINLDQIPTLDKISNLNMKLSSRVIEAYHGNRCGNGLDLASTLFAIIFENMFQKQNDGRSRVLFYQIVTFDSRKAYFNGGWFDTAPHYGIDDSIQIYKKPHLVPGRRAIRYNVDIADRIKKLIQKGPTNDYLNKNDLPELDKDLSHWRPIVFREYL